MKKDKKESVLHDWMLELPFTQQALLMLSLRGPDGITKYSGAKAVIHYMRGVVLRPAYPDFMEMDGFMRIDYENFLETENAFFVDTDLYPMHFLMHLIHAAEVIGYKHPNMVIRSYWHSFYDKACNCFHMHMEKEEELDNRLKY